MLRPLLLDRLETAFLVICVFLISFIIATAI